MGFRHEKRNKPQFKVQVSPVDRRPTPSGASVSATSSSTLHSNEDHSNASQSNGESINSVDGVSNHSRTNIYPIDDPFFLAHDHEDTEILPTSSIGNTDGETNQNCPSVEKITNPNLSIDDKAMLEIITLVDSSGARRGLYNDLMVVLRKHSRLGFDPINAKSREAFVSSMHQKVHVPDPIRTMVKGTAVFRFPLFDMIQDLLHSPLFDSLDNLCVNADSSSRFCKFIPSSENDNTEVMARKWASDTFDELDDFDGTRDFFLPLILYADKTGADKYQRYPLEPWMVTTPLLRRNARESPRCWRHIGFIPPSEMVEGSEPDPSEEGDEEVDNNADEPSDEHCKTTAQANIQLYHDYLSVLLTDLKHARTIRPEFIVNFGGVIEKRRAHIHVGIIVGDQKSQDTICGRVPANGGGAGRIHRGCMCSSVYASRTIPGSCNSLPNPEVFGCLNKIALSDPKQLGDEILSLLPSQSSLDKRQRRLAAEYAQRRVRLARALLAHPYTMYPLRNGFDGVPFGANRWNVFLATAEDHLHCSEAGVFEYLNKVSYGIMTDKEATDFEDCLRTHLSSMKSSALSQYPLTKIKKNFTNQSLMTHTEKVGSTLNFLLSMHIPGCRSIWEQSLKKQQQKYSEFPKKKKAVTTSEPSNDRSQKSSDANRNKRDSSNARAQKASNGSRNKRQKTNNSSSATVPSVNERLPASSFPFRSDVYFKGERNKANPFDFTHSSISFVCKHLFRHGFSFVLSESGLDELQLYQLMVGCYGILHSLQSKECDEIYPTRSTIDCISDASIKDMFKCANQTLPSSRSSLELTCRQSLACVPIINKGPSCSAYNKTPRYHHSVPIVGCTKKHRRRKPKVKGSGFTGAVLSSPKTYRSYIEYLLCFHSWCHYCYQLPQSYQNDLATIEFGSRMVVQYFDSILYRGDATVDSDTCKLHSHLHIRRVYEMFGDLMQYNAATGERGLKFWAMGASRTARKHGIDQFTSDTMSRIVEEILLKKLVDCTTSTGHERNDPEDCDSCDDKQNNRNSTANTTFRFTRRGCHFRYIPNEFTPLVTLNRKGKHRPPDNVSGKIEKVILEAISEFEVDDDSIDIWCEADIGGRKYVRCWPNYRMKGPWYDWVWVTFPMDGGSTQACYPAKVLAFYVNGSGEKKAMIQSVEYKTQACCEGPYGDSRLVTHYRKEFQHNGRPSLRSIPVEDIKATLLACESMPNKHSPIPGIIPLTDRKLHTVMIIRPRSEWARLFMEWTREIMERRETDESSSRFCL